MSKVLGIDVGGTHTRWGIVEYNQVVHVEKVKSHSIRDFVDFVNGIVEDYQDIKYISMGVPGIVSQNKIINIPNLAVLNIENLADLIEVKTGKPTIINRDVRLLFENDIYGLDLVKENNILAFYLGTGIGNVIKINGKVLEGVHGFAAELGHIPIHHNFEMCPCGKEGCSEILFSGKGLVALFEKHNLSGPFKDIFLNHKNHLLIQNFLKGFAEVIGIEMNILDITHMIIGGGVTNMKGFPKETLNNLIEKHLRSSQLKDDLKIYYVNDSPTNSILGASLMIEELN